MLKLPENKYPVTQRIVREGTHLVYPDDVVLNCDSTNGNITINLAEIQANYWSTQYRLYINDYSKTAGTNSITIIAGDGQKINGGDNLIISTNGVSAAIEITSNTEYIGVLSQGNSGSGEIVVANTCYVMKNGNDSTGLVERLDKPFLTINAAINAVVLAFPEGVRSISNRIQIIVENGEYIEPNILKLYPYIDFDLSSATVAGSFTDEGVLELTQYGVVSNFITGNPFIVCSSEAIKIVKEDTFISFKCNWIYRINNEGSIITMTDGILNLEVNFMGYVSSLISDIPYILIDNSSSLTLINSNIISSTNPLIELSNSDVALRTASLTLINSFLRNDGIDKDLTLYQSSLIVGGKNSKCKSIIKLNNSYFRSVKGNLIYLDDNTNDIQLYCFGFNASDKDNFINNPNITNNITTLINNLCIDDNVINPFNRR